MDAGEYVRGFGGRFMERIFPWRIRDDLAVSLDVKIRLSIHHHLILQ